MDLQTATYRAGIPGSNGLIKRLVFLPAGLPAAGMAGWNGVYFFWVLFLLLNEGNLFSVSLPLNPDFRLIHSSPLIMS